MKDNEIHLIGLRLHTDRLARFELTQNLPNHHDDLGYVTHGLLRALFGDLGPKTFVVSQHRRGREIEVLGYSHANAESLRQHAAQFAEPSAHEVVVADSIASKTMPLSWPVGTRIGFVLRACPIKRLAKRDPSGELDRPEVDAWLHACWQDPKAPAPDRETVYANWLRASLETTNAVSVEQVRVDSFRIARLIRRTKRTADARKTHALERPDVYFSGVMTVRDGDAFAAVLRRGIGRHRSFGFGMLKLLPPAALL